MSFVPVTPAGSVCAHLESDTEEEAWTALMKDAAHMPYPDKAAFINRGYTVEAWGENKTTLDELQDKVSLAMQSDLEHGVAWMNEEAAAKFAKEYPSIIEVLGWIAEIDEIIK